MKLTHAKNNRGITLAELLVASVMIGIVIVGVASFSLAIRNMENSTNRTVVISLKTKTAMAILVKDASLAVGDPLDNGIATYDVGGNRSICFRQDADNEPSTYTGDLWTCYFQDATGALDGPLESCGTFPSASGNVPVQDNVDCDAGSLRKDILDLEDGAPIWYDVILDGSGRLGYIRLDLQTIYNPSLPENPITNPRYTIHTKIVPQGHSH